MKSQNTRPSLRGAVDAYCRDCTTSPDLPGRWREQVAACPSTGCPLYAFRPGRQRAPAVAQ